MIKSEITNPKFEGSTNVQKENLMVGSRCEPPRFPPSCLTFPSSFGFRASTFFSLVAIVCLAGADPTDEAPPPPAKQLFRGEVLKTADALKRLKVKAYPQELQEQVALLTPEKEIIPILPDWRGRAFFQDERLRDRKVELIGYRRPGVPYLQVLTVYTFDQENTRNYTDYWCDICAIPMYEIKPCDCCQQEIRLRFQPQELPAEFRSVTP